MNLAFSILISNHASVALINQGLLKLNRFTIAILPGNEFDYFIPSRFDAAYNQFTQILTVEVTHEDNINVHFY